MFLFILPSIVNSWYHSMQKKDRIFLYECKGRVTQQWLKKNDNDKDAQRERILLVELLQAEYAHAYLTDRGNAFLTFSFSFSLSRPVWPGLSWARSGSCRSWGSFAGFVHVKAEWIRTPDSSSGVSDQQSVGFESWSWYLCPYTRHLSYCFQRTKYRACMKAQSHRPR